MNKSSKLLLLVVTAFLLASTIEVQCRRTYTSRSSSSGRGNRGKNQPSSGGVFSSWFGGSKSGSSSSGSGSKSAPTSSKKNWETASAGHSSSSNWANPYYKPSGGAAVPSAPKEANYGWKAANTKPVSSYPSSNIGSQGYPVQSGVQQASHTSYGGYKPASGVPASGYQPSQTAYGGYRPASGVPNTGYPQQTGYHSNYHPPQTAPAHGYQPSYTAPHQPAYQPSYTAPHQPAYQPSGGYYSGAPHTNFHQPSHVGYSPQASFGSAVPSYQGTKLFSNGGHYGYPGGSSWGIDTYGSKKSSGTGKLLTGLAVGAAGGYLAKSLVSGISNPWKYSGYGYGTGFGYGGYGSSYDLIRSRDESAFERGFERGVKAQQNENNKEAAPAEPEDPTAKWVQCVAFDPQTQQTLINPNCSCTVTTSVDDRTGQPMSVHHCTTLNGLVMRPVPVGSPENLPPPGDVGGRPVGQPVGQPVGGINAPGAAPDYGNAYLGNFEYGGGATVYIPPQPKIEPKPEPKEETKTEQSTTDAKPEQSATDAKPEQSATDAKPEQSVFETKPETATGTVTEPEVTTDGKVEPVLGESKDAASPKAEELSGGLQDNRKRTADFYGQLQKIVNMGSFADGG